MNAEALLRESGSAQARAITAGRISGSELRSAQLALIAARNPEINAFVQVADARGAASPAERGSKLSGACFAVKDNIDVAGMPTNAGLRALHARPAQHDAVAVARLRSAGLACVGKLNMHAAALGATNHNLDFGNCRNPRRLTHTPGGSSGGSAAAVAAHLCAISLGTDTMGSVRIPAAYCGVVGFKPSFEAIPVEGLVPLCRLLDHIGILARSVEDVGEAFRIVAGNSVPTHATGEVRQLVFAIPAASDALPMEPEVRAAFDAALRRLRDAGFALRELDLAAYPFSRVRRAGLLLSEAELIGTLAHPLANHRDELPGDLLAMMDFAAGKSAPDLARALSTVVAAGQWVHRALLPFDALLLPTAGQTAFPMDGPVPAEQADFTALANMAGAPSISLPLPVGPQALPVGVQLIGRRGEDLALLDAALLVEAALR